MSIILKFLLILSVNFYLSQADNEEVKGGQQGIKSYSGVFQHPDQNQNTQYNPTYQQLNQQVPMFYQPFGWNYNSQKLNSYGGVIHQTPQPQQGFGWFGAGNQYGNQFPQNDPNPAFPKNPNPSLFLPNYVPPVYFQNTLPFPNYNPFPYPSYNQGGQQPNFQGGQQPGSYGGQQPNSQGGQYPNLQGGHYPANSGQYPANSPPGQLPFPSKPIGQAPHHNTGSNVFPGQGHNSYAGDQENPNNRVDSTDNQFATNAFFKPTDSDRHWTEEDEQKWQATTKAPYFENKVPGLECSLPASAVLGATTALKASSLLPLNVPAGKPILSCNATELLQAQISLSGTIYDCSQSSITMSCSRVDANNYVVDDCHGKTLECDVRTRQNSRSISCTNGTLISNQPIVCESATLTPNKNVLNCLFKNNRDSDDFTTTRPYRPHPTSRPPPASTIHTSVIPLAPVTENPHEGIDTRYSQNDKTATGLTHEVKTAMKNVFPHELLSQAPSQMYLPPKIYGMGQLPDDVKHHLVGVFPHDLFASSQTDNFNEQGGDSESRLSAMRGTNVNNQHQFSEHRQSQWDINANRKSGNSGMKTAQQKLPQRFGGTGDDGIDNDRLIFSP